MRTSELPTLASVQLHWSSGKYKVITASPMGQQVKNHPAMQEMPVRSLGWEDPLEEDGNPLQYSCLRIPWGNKKSDTIE